MGPSLMTARRSRDLQEAVHPLLPSPLLTAPSCPLPPPPELGGYRHPRSNLPQLLALPRGPHTSLSSSAVPKRPPGPLLSTFQPQDQSSTPLLYLTRCLPDPGPRAQPGAIVKPLPTAAAWHLTPILQPRSSQRVGVAAYPLTPAPTQSLAGGALVRGRQKSE